MLIDDSKKLSHAQRAKLRPIIEEQALAWAVAFVPPQEIDEINILNASFLAMRSLIIAASNKLSKLYQILDCNK